MLPTRIHDSRTNFDQEILYTSLCPHPLREPQNARCKRGIGGKYRSPSEEIGKENTLVGADLSGEPRSGIPKVRAGGVLRVLMEFEQFWVGESGKTVAVSFPRP